jgi:hypothetical protein
VVVCGAVIFLRSGNLVELYAHEADLNTRIRTINQNIKNAKDLEQQVQEVELLVEQIEARLFDREQRAININFFYDLEDRMDVRIANISQMPSEDSTYAKGGPRELKLHSTIAYSMSLNGKFDEILRFMYELYRVEPLIRVADFQIATANLNSNEGELEARLRLVVLAEKANP